MNKKHFIFLGAIALVAVALLFASKAWKARQTPDAAAPLADGAEVGVAETVAEGAPPDAVTALRSAGRSAGQSAGQLAAAQKGAILDSILASKNDNDPRLDTDFKKLTRADKKFFKKKYASLPMEKRNERGTIVFLLGREAREAADFLFLKDVLAEKPCLSLSDCTVEYKPGDHPHSETSIEISLAYPQIVALKQAARALEEERAAGRTRSERYQEALATVRAGRLSRVPVVARMAAETDTGF